MLAEPKFESLPTSEDFNYDGEVDERWTRDHYLGQDIEFVIQRFRTHHALSILHHWYYVGIRAFRYTFSEHSDISRMRNHATILICITPSRNYY